MVRAAFFTITKLKAIMFSDAFSWPVALGAISSPWWLVVIEKSSAFAALFLPIVGLAIAILKLVAMLRGKSPPSE